MANAPASRRRTTASAAGFICPGQPQQRQQSPRSACGPHAPTRLRPQRTTISNCCRAVRAAKQVVALEDEPAVQQPKALLALRVRHGPTGPWPSASNSTTVRAQAAPDRIASSVDLPLPRRAHQQAPICPGATVNDTFHRRRRPLLVAVAEAARRGAYPGADGAWPSSNMIHSLGIRH